MTVVDAALLKREILLRSIFPSMPAAAHARFIEILEDVEAAAGEIIFAPGEAPDRFLFLTEGRVIMEREGEEAWVFTPIAVIGVIDAVLERTRLRGCRALEPSQLLSLRASDWFDMLEDNAQIARAAVRNFATQLHGRWRELAPRLTRTSQPPPGAVGASLETFEKILILRHAGFLRRAGMQAIGSLATIAEPVALRPGQALFEVGAQAENLYVVARGVIELAQGDDFRVRQQAGDLIGGAAALCKALPAYSARAVSDAVVLRLPEQDFYDQAEEHPGLTRGTLAYLVTELEALLALDPKAQVAPGAQGPMAALPLPPLTP